MNAKHSFRRLDVADDTEDAIAGRDDAVALDEGEDLAREDAEPGSGSAALSDGRDSPYPVGSQYDSEPSEDGYFLESDTSFEFRAMRVADQYSRARAGNDDAQDHDDDGDTAMTSSSPPREAGLPVRGTVMGRPPTAAWAPRTVNREQRAYEDALRDAGYTRVFWDRPSGEVLGTVNPEDVATLSGTLAPQAFLRLVRDHLASMNQVVAQLQGEIRRRERIDDSRRLRAEATVRRIQSRRGGGLTTTFDVAIAEEIALATIDNGERDELNDMRANYHALFDRADAFSMLHSTTHLSLAELREEVDILATAVERGLSRGQLTTLVHHAENRDVLRRSRESAVAARVTERDIPAPATLRGDVLSMEDSRRFIHDAAYDIVFGGIPDAVPGLEEDPLPTVIVTDGDAPRPERNADEDVRHNTRPGTPPDRVNDDTGVYELRAIAEAYGYRSSLKAATTARERPSARGKTMRVYLEVQKLQAYVLMDTGSTINAISPDFCKVAGLRPFPLSNPITLQLGCSGSRSKVNYGVNIPVEIAGVHREFYFDVASLDHYDIIVGTQIMQDLGMVLDFRDYTIRVGKTSLSALEGEGTKPATRENRRHGGKRARPALEMVAIHAHESPDESPVTHN
ncbi:retropepsin-like domain-containing protein [Phanerochaete sordida]|uniref:Retropepsin-like domain-containing protein n=1 Tax=Phanerochaete sordida TaxID=48140 RepID=A0A9P3GP38_9APHY|nr:retropepsin-like domain-containing protein [Phanerochaete sordida]